MAKKVQNQDLIADNIFLPAKENAEALLGVLDRLEIGFKDVAKTAKKELKNVKIDDLSGIEKASKAIKDVDSAAKGLSETEKERIKLQEKLKQQRSTAIDQNVRLKRTVQEQIKANKDFDIISDKNAGTLQKLTAQNRILRRERERLNLDTEKGRKRLQEINKELDKNNQKILENSDKLKKQRLNVGNYTSSIKEAAEASGLFGGVIGKLNQIQAVLNALTKVNTVEEEVNTVAKETNTAATVQLTTAQRALNAATGAGTKALKIFKSALAASGIGLLLIAVGSLVAFFTRVQEGVDKIDESTAGLTAGLDVLIDRLSAASGGFIKIFEGLSAVTFAAFRGVSALFSALQGNFLEARDKAGDLFEDLKNAPENVIDGINEVREAFKGIGDELKREIQLATELKALTTELTREQKLFEAEQAKTLTTVKELTLIAKDKLQDDQRRLEALGEINRLEEEIAVKQVALQERALAASLDSISADKTRLELGAEQLDFIERIKTGQIGAAEAVKLAADFTLSSAAGEQALFEIVEKIVAQEQARQNLLDKQATTAKRTSALVQEIANKNSKALLQEAKLQQLIAKDEDESIENRIKAIELVRDLSIEASKIRLEANLEDEKEFIAFRLTEEKRAQEEIQKLLLKTNDDIDKDLEKRIKKQVDTINAIEQEQFKFEIDRLSRLIEAEETTQEERIKLINQANELRRSQLESQAEFELSNDELTAEERELIQQKLQNDLANLEDERVDAVKAANEKILEEDISLKQERIDNATETAKEITQIFDESFGEILAKRLDALNEEEERSKSNLELQEQLAAQGVEGAAERADFERAKQAEIEAERKQLEKERELEEQAAALAKAYLGFLQARANAAETEEEINAAPGKALQDTAKGAVIAQGAKGLARLVAGSAYEGVEDTGGAGTIDSKGGKLWILHPHEGVVKREANENYQGLVGAMNNGEVDSWFMKNLMIQPNLNFDKTQSENHLERSFQQLASQVQRVEKAIENKPVQWIDADGLGNIVETIIEKRGKKQITHQRFRKKI